MQEFIALNEYLYSVNNPLIQTKIKFQLYFSNDMDLDTDLFDSVVAYLESWIRLLIVKFYPCKNEVNIGAKNECANP